MLETEQMKSAHTTLCNWRDYFIINKNLDSIKQLESSPVGFVVAPQLKENFYHSMIVCMEPLGNA